MRHTKEPWNVPERNKKSILAPHKNGEDEYYAEVAECVIEEDASRIIACVNAFTGMNPEYLPGLITAAKEMVAMRHGGCVTEQFREALSKLLSE